MTRAAWNGEILAEAPRTVRVEGNHHFPPDSVRREFFTGSPSMSGCPWKGLPHSGTSRSLKADRLPVWRTGLTGGLVGVLCCVGPTVLALLGIVSAGTAFAWATDLYDNHAWWFRLGGLAIALGTYVAPYALTTWLGTFA